MNKKTAANLKIGDEVISQKDGSVNGLKYHKGHIGFVTYKNGDDKIVVGLGAGHVTGNINLDDWEPKNPKRFREKKVRLLDLPVNSFSTDILSKAEYNKIANHDLFSVRPLSTGSIDVGDKTETFDLFMDGKFNLHFRFFDDEGDANIYTLPFQDLLNEIKNVRERDLLEKTKVGKFAIEMVSEEALG